MIQITKRDNEIIEFLNKVVVADTSTINILFFNSLRACQQRLKLLCEYNYLRCFRPTQLSQNIFYLKKKPKSWKHKLIFSSFMGHLKSNGIEILKYKTPLPIGDIIADGFLALNINGFNKLYFVEGENTKYFNTDKYLNLYYSRKWKEIFPVFPSIIVISDKKVKKDDKLNIIHLSMSFDNINAIYCN